MPSRLPAIDLGRSPEAVRQFFQSLGDEPVAVEQDGAVLYIIYPAKQIAAQLAGEALKHVRGAWGVPDDICEQIAEGNR